MAWTQDISDGVVLIRRLEPADAAPWAQAFRDDPELGASIGVERDPTEADAAAQIAEAARSTQPESLAIADAATGEFRGVIGLYQRDVRHRRGEIGVWLVPSARSQCIASKALALFTTWAFDAFALDRVELTTTPDNIATRRLARKLGFQEEGVLRARNLERGRRVDVVMLAVLRGEWSR